MAEYVEENKKQNLESVASKEDIYKLEVSFDHKLYELENRMNTRMQ